MTAINLRGSTVSRTQSVGELFSGPGGLGMGAHLANQEIDGIQFRHRWASDYDADSCATFAQNVGSLDGTQIFHEDVRNLDLSALPDIDGFSFGFPCNDFSSVGKQLGISGKFGPLYRYGVEILRQKQPDWFIGENVSGLKSPKNLEAFRLILREMRDSGYEVTPHLYKFEQYGVPQSRHRIIVVGMRSDLGVLFKVPAPNLDIRRSARAALEDPPIPEGAPNHEFSVVSSRVRSRLGHIPPGGNAFNSPIPEEFQLRVSGATMSQIYRRLHPDKPAYTVTGSGGGGTYIYHWEEDRPLTNRERARLQTFPDDFYFVGSRTSVRKQIGMAVPVLASKMIHLGIAKTLLSVSYTHVEPNLLSHLQEDQLPLNLT